MSANINHIHFPKTYVATYMVVIVATIHP